MNRLLPIVTSIILFSTLQLMAQKKQAKPTLWLKGTVGKNSLAEETFNFNPVYIPENGMGLSHSNIIKSQHSLFAVFKSAKGEEKSLLTIETSSGTIKFYNKKAEGIKSFEYNKGNPDKGIVLSYLVSLQAIGKKPNSLTIENLGKQGKEAPFELMELMYYQQTINPAERQKVETYLSVKYGISMIGNTDYISSKNDTIWDSKNNQIYSSRVTGIGRDDKFGLLQKQSGNSEIDGLYMGFGTIEKKNSLNKSSIEDKEFLLWGDNAKSTDFKKGNAGVRNMGRIWKIQKTSENDNDMPIQVLIDKQKMTIENDPKNPSNDEKIWLAISRDSSSKFDYANAEYFAIDKETIDTCVFNNIVWDIDKNGTDLFTFIKAPDFFVAYDVKEPKCDEQVKGQISLKIQGGEAPFRITLKGEKEARDYTTMETFFEIENLPDGDYQISVSDKNANEQVAALVLHPFNESVLSIAQKWQLDENGSVEIFPILEDSSDYKFEWTFDGTVMSTEKQLLASKAGTYTLKATNSYGCSKEFLVDVSDKSSSPESQLILYPNPIKAGESFTLQFSLDEIADVAVSIYSMDGKLIKTKSLYSVKDIQYNDSLAFAGSYLVVVSVKGNTNTIKLIVN